MKVKAIYDKDIINKDETLHIKERKERIRKYSNLLSFKMLYCFRVDNDHWNGDEIHCINEYGLIYIYNYKSKKYITILHPRPSQLKRYFHQLNITLPNDIKRLIDKCYKRNKNSNMNEL
jgi:hypothetical protein